MNDTNTKQNEDKVVAYLTKRELIAAMAIQGLVSTRDTPEKVAKDAVAYADALIAELATP